MVGYIYQIKNTITNQSYIGQTINICQRKRTHFNELRGNRHENPKLQASWNKYGEEAFDFTFWEFDITSRQELNNLECEYIEKFDGLSEGFNLAPGGGMPPNVQKIDNEEIITFLCIQHVYGDGYGKTCESIFDWAKGTASKIKLKKGYAKAWEIYSQLSKEEILIKAEDFMNSQKLNEKALNRQLTQGGSIQSYSLTQSDYNLAFCAKDMGYGAPEVAAYFQIKESTVYDWFNGRSRVREKEKYLALPIEEKEKIKNNIQEINLDKYKKTKLISKKEEDIIDYFCCKEFYNITDAAIQAHFHWSDGSCYQLRKPKSALSAKIKFNLLTTEQKQDRATKLYLTISSTNRPY